MWSQVLEGEGGGEGEEGGGDEGGGGSERVEELEERERRGCSIRGVDVGGRAAGSEEEEVQARVEVKF